MADTQLCQRIACGAVSQAEAGLRTLWECSEAGYVGVLPCSHPDCQPYLPELWERGICQSPEPGPVVESVFELLPLHPPVQPDEGEEPLPPVEQAATPTALAPLPQPPELPSIRPVAPLPSITRRPALAVPVEASGQAREAYCRLMTWVAANQWMAAVVILAWWALSKRGR